MKRILALTVAFLLVASTAIAADIELAKSSHIEKILQSGKLRVGFESGYMPFEMTNKKGDFVGFDIDMAKEMAKAMGVEFAPVNTAWDGIIPALLTDKFDIIMSGMTVTQDRNLKVMFADPYIVVGQTLIINPNMAPEVESYRDLNESKYIVTSKLGTTGEQAVQRMIPKCTYKSFETEQEAVLEVLNGKAHAFVYDLPYCVVFMAQQGADAGLNFIDKPFTYEPLAWAINKGDPDFLNWLNNFLRQMKNDGRYDMIYNKWIKSTDWIKDVQE